MEQAAQTADSLVQNHSSPVLLDAQDSECAESYRKLGEALQSQGEYAAAMLSIEQAIRLNPLNVRSWVTLSEILYQAKEISASLDCLRQALQLEPQDVRARLLLGNLQKQLGNCDAAISNFKYVLNRDADNVVAAVNLASTLREQGKTLSAIPLLRRAAEKQHQSPQVLFNLANALVDVGEFQEARAHYEAALRTHPHPAKVLFNLTSITRFTADQRQSLTEKESFVRPKLKTNDDWVHYHFAMGKALDDLCDFDAAFAHFEQGNQRVPVQFDPVAAHEKIERWMDCWSLQFLQERQHGSEETRAPIFIVGMPRSGTTLVEQLLAGDSRIQPLGERPLLGTLVRNHAASLGCEDDEHQAVERLTQTDVSQVAQDYLAESSLADDQTHFTDKLPGNFLLLGWVALCFPQATIIHCRRDPRDVCLSCYFQHFTARLPYTYHLEHLAAYFQSYSQLMSHWQNVLPGRILDVSYEDLVEAPESEIEKVLAHLGLKSNHSRQTTPGENRVVQTASAWQVRQPIYKHSRQRWINYREHIAPLLEIFGDTTESPD